MTGRIRSLRRHLAAFGFAHVCARCATVPRSSGCCPFKVTRRNAYTQDDLITLQALADHCGGALERIRAEAENQKLAAFPQFNPNPVLELAADGTINYFNEAAAADGRVPSANSIPSEFLPAETAAWVTECLASGESKLRLADDH